MKNTFFALVGLSLCLIQCSPKKPLPLASVHSGNYYNAWQTVDSLEKKGLFRSADPLVREILNKSIVDKNPAQAHKSLMHILRYDQALQENNEKNLVSYLDSVIAQAKFPVSNMLSGSAAVALWSYYQNNQWVVLARETDATGNDIREWSRKNFIDKVTSLHLNALNRPEELMQISNDAMLDVLDSDINNCTVRPTLYDLLAHQAIDFYKSDQANLFSIDKCVSPTAQLLSNNADFIELKIIESKESNWSTAIILWQKLTAFHLSRNDLSSLANITVERLNALRPYVKNANVDSLYQSSLNQLIIECKDDKAEAIPLMQKAVHLENRGQQNSVSKDTQERWFLKDAIEICDKVLQLTECDSIYLQHALSIKSRIENKQLSITTEQTVVPNKEWLASINYRNLDEVYLTVAKLDYETYLEVLENNEREKQIELLTSKAMIRNLNIKFELDDEGDYRPHSKEVPLPPLSAGFYIVVSAPQNEVIYDNTNIYINPIWVSNISWSNRSTPDGKNEFNFVDRTSGRAAQNVSATLYIQQYNQYKRRMVLDKSETYQADAEGRLIIPQSTNSQRFRLKISNGKETIWPEQSFYQYTANQTEKAVIQTHFFTDRKVYRPGQEVFYKGIAVESKGESRKLKTGLSETVFLYDANYQVVSKQDVVTNEFGSYHGSFLLPETGLTGTFRIETARGQTYFNVEEYKRPTFEAEINLPDSAYSINQNITVKGVATALAGFPISNAQVNYRVQRTVITPWWRWWRGGWPGTSDRQEVVSGITQTNADGEFEIQFKAKEPDQVGFPEEYYRFEIVADVVDVSGETRAATQTITIGRNSLLLSSFSEPIAKSGEFNEIEIIATNLNGKAIPTAGVVEIYQLVAEEKAYRTRLWATADQHELSKEDFSVRFPLDELPADKEEPEFKLGDQMLKTNFNTSTSTKVKIPESNNWNPGKYLLRLSAKDASGKEVKFEHSFIVYNPQKKKPAVPHFLWTHAEELTAQPGEKVQIHISSGVEAQILVETEFKGQIINRQLLQIKNELVSIQIPVKEEHRGNIGVHISTTLHNRFYEQSYTIEVPYSNKKLDIKLETFRDKMLPGSNEEWTLKVTDNNGKAVSAEVLATMYDASLDLLGFTNNWSFFPYQNRGIRMAWNSTQDVSGGWAYQKNWNSYTPYYAPSPCGLNYFGLQFQGKMDYYAKDNMMIAGGNISRTQTAVAELMMDGVVADEVMAESIPAEQNQEKSEDKNDQISVRENLNETAFFQPSLSTDKNGILNVKFTMPESITAWKFMALGHTKALQIGEVEQETITQKTLMVIPNPPRFMRQGDEFLFTGKVVNLSQDKVAVNAKLTFTNTLNNQAVNILLDEATKAISLNPSESKAVQWKVKVPDDVSIVDFVMSAVSEKHTDAEKRVLPVLSNRMLVTESLPLPVYGKGTTNFKFDHLLNSEAETGLKHHRLTLEFSANPAWYAVQALPYMMEYPHDCSEQIFTRYYANALAAHIVESKPGIAEIFKKYSAQTPEALWSNLQKNQELKNVLLEETPWVLAAENETEAKKNMALLFEMNRMSLEQQKAIDKLAESQLAEGAWPWFKGMQPSRYITQYLVEGMGRLKYLGVSTAKHSKVTTMMDNAVRWLDNEFIKDFKKIENKEKAGLSSSVVHYLYVRSMFPERARSQELQNAFQFYISKAPDQWINLDLYTQGMLALAAYRLNEKNLSAEITKSIAERSIMNTEQGRFWKNTWGFYWYNMPIETQSLMVELFTETGASTTYVNELKLWLLKQKQVQNWKTTKATANACFALLMSGDDWLKNSELPSIKVGDYNIVYKESDKKSNEQVLVSPEPGTAHFKTVWNADEIDSNMANVSVENKHTGPAWGALYWQYFQDMDKIVAHDSPLKITREFYSEELVNGVRKAISLENTSVKPGDRILVRIVLETDRDMEYVHLKDQRGAGLEPMESRSGYEWKGGLGYYKSIRDASTNFFFDWLPKGRHVFEYELRANLSGSFSHGIGTVQSMYAPEFSSHSHGQRFVIE